MADTNSSSSSSEGGFEVTGTFGDFATVLVINVCICIGILTAFWLLRLLSINEYFFAPRYYDNLETKAEVLPPLGSHPFAWILPVWNYSEEVIAETRGLDAVMYLKFTKYMMFLFLAFIPFGFILLIPIDVTAPGVEDTEGVAELSMSNVAQQSYRLWAHAVVAYIFYIIAYYLIYRLYKEYVRLRLLWMKKDEPHNYTVMYKGIPVDKFENNCTPPEYFAQHFNALKAVDIQCALKAESLRSALVERKNMHKKINAAQVHTKKHGRRPYIRTISEKEIPVPLVGKKTDSITYFRRKFQELTERINRKRSKLETKLEYSTYGFVTFETMGAAYQNAQMLMHSDVLYMKPSPAPDHRDINWEKLSDSRWVKVAVGPLMYIGFFFLIFFWGIPVYFVQSLVHIDKIAKVEGFGWLEKLDSSNSIISGFLQGFLPALILILFFALLPLIIEKIINVRGTSTKSSLVRNVFRIYYLFLIVNVFLVSLLAGPVLQVLDTLLNTSAPDVLVLLGGSLPANANFFINYILTYELFKFPFQMLRIGDFILSRYKRVSGFTEHECREAEKPDRFNYHVIYAIECLIFCVGITYAPLSPFILPWTAFYFAITYLIGKYLLLYVYKVEYDSGGLFFPLVFNRLMAGMILGQLTLIGAFVLKEISEMAYIMIPFPFITLAFSMLIHKYYDAPSMYLPFNQYPSDLNNGAKHVQAYLDPVLKASEYRLTLDDRINSDEDFVDIEKIARNSSGSALSDDEAAVELMEEKEEKEKKDKEKVEDAAGSDKDTVGADYLSE